MDQRPNIRAKTTKLLGENKGEYLHDIQLASEFSDMMPKAQATKEKKKKKRKEINIKLKIFCRAKKKKNKKAIYKRE